MINWKNIKDHTPDNSKELHEIKPSKPFGQSSTPYVPCIVWVCNPNFIQSGVFRAVRWDTENKQWLKSDMFGDWIFQEPYIITHFTDEINVPTE